MLMKIFLNAGHGGKDPGAISKNGNKEADITKKVCSLLAYELIKNGYNIEFYQQEKSVTDISEVENTSNSDLFVSIHCNAAVNETANGAEVLYYPTSVKGKKYAQKVQDELVNITKLRDRGIKARSDLHVLKRTKAPAILVELAFLSNTHEEMLLVDYPEMFANALLKGIKKLT